MLGNIDQRHCEIARGTQNGQSQRTDQHDVAGGGPPRCQSTTAQASKAIVSTTVIAACVIRSFSR